VQTLQKCRTGSKNARDGIVERMDRSMGIAEEGSQEIGDCTALLGRWVGVFFEEEGMNHGGKHVLAKHRNRFL
jgi:hypothetical protein